MTLSINDIERLIRTPHFFNVIKFAYFRPKDVDNNIPGVNGNPIGLTKPFDFNVLNATNIQAISEFLCEGANMARGIARSYYHVIGQTTLIVKIDRDYVFGLICVQ